MKAEATQIWDSALDSVVVYAQGALCRRVARGGVPPDGRVRITGLPRALGPGSLAARVVGASGVRVVEARVEVDSVPNDGPAPDELEREVERLHEECAAVRARRDRQLGLVEEVRGLRPIPPAPDPERDDPPRPTPVDAWLELSDFVDARLADLHARLDASEEALLHAEHDLSVAVDALARSSTDTPPAHVSTTVSALVTLARTPDGQAAEQDTDVEPEPEVEVELEYEVPGAVWIPAYRLDHRQGDGSGRLVLRASVAQRTGEDWNSVRLSLATADLRRRTDLPRLRSIRIGRRQPAPAPSGWREPPAGLSDLFTGYDVAAPRTAAPRTSARGTRPAAARKAAVMPPMAAGAVGAVQAYDTGPHASAVHAPQPPQPAPAPQEYGPAAPPPVPAQAAYFPAPPMPRAAYGAPPPPAPGSSGSSTVPPSAPGGPPALAAPVAPVAPSGAMPAAPPVGPPHPSGAELDYAALVLAGPEEQAGRRGLLFPDSSFDPVATERRRDAESVASLPLPGHAVRPRESAGSFDHRFDAHARTDIPSDGTWHTVTITEIPVGLRTEYLCVPSVEETVYTTLVLSNATDQALLAGPVEVTVDDDFLLTTALPTLAPGGTRRVGLGPAEAIRVTRRTELRESSSGLRNTTTVLDHRVHVELVNRLARPVAVEVRERVPVTSDPDIRIDERADWTTPEEGAGPDTLAPGTRVRRVELPAQGSATLDGGYEIRIPAGKALVDGNRRS
ncbi:DUF4139 domain-containing protein [Streptomyces dioscori]|uniref:DUF4139 domain-containing protein n=1 Tax=Streptomyces dioscori TaxID=2109333 RepID=UPI001CED602B|nr:DUF4139 domain-containing protein [Streptomyces dioscori]